MIAGKSDEDEDKEEEDRTEYPQIIPKQTLITKAEMMMNYWA